MSIVITRVATVMLTATGLSRDVARSQARSAFSGAGFTTNESESVVNHPVRRRIVLQLMLLGAAGVVTSLTSLLLSFTDATGTQTANRIVVLLAGLVGCGCSPAAASSTGRSPDHRVGAAEDTRLGVRDYDKLLHLSDHYSVAEIDACKGDWLVGRSLGDLRLRDEGVMVLGIYRRSGDYLGVARPTTVVEDGDRLVVYGEEDVLPRLAERTGGAAGDAEHDGAVQGYRRRGRPRPCVDSASDSRAR